MPKGNFKKKEPFADLPQEFKDTVDNCDEKQCREQLAKIGLAQDEVLESKKNDQHLREAGEVYKDAGQQYRDGTKSNRLKTRYVVERLKAMGKA